MFIPAPISATCSEMEVEVRAVVDEFRSNMDYNGFTSIVDYMEFRKAKLADNPSMSEMDVFKEYVPNPKNEVLTNGSTCVGLVQGLVDKLEANGIKAFLASARHAPNALPSHAERPLPKGEKPLLPHVNETEYLEYVLVEMKNPEMILKKEIAFVSYVALTSKVIPQGQKGERHSIRIDFAKGVIAIQIGLGATEKKYFLPYNEKSLVDGDINWDELRTLNNKPLDEELLMNFKNGNFFKPYASDQEFIKNQIITIIKERKNIVQALGSIRPS